MTGVRVFAANWADTYPRPDASTNQTHRSMAKEVAAYFGHIELSDVTRAEARQFALRRPGHLRYARAMFNDALDDEIVTRNPFAALGIRRPRVKVPTPSLDEVLALIEVAPTVGGVRLESMIRFAAFTGLRLGEQLALSPQRINGGRVAVLDQIDKRGDRKACKADSERSVLVPIQAHPIPPLTSCELLWPYARSTHHRDWKAVCTVVGVDYRWHALRHFCATWLLNLGASSEDVAVQLGHHDGGTLVRETYGDPDPELALDRLAALAA